MRHFKWIEWNVQKIESHGLSREEVEAAFDDIVDIEERRDGSCRMYARLPNGRQVCVIWRYDRRHDPVPDILGDIEEPPIFVITAY